MIERYPDIPKFILTRNPWSWYVSWYYHKLHHWYRTKDNLNFEYLEFPDYLRRMLTADHSEEPNPNRRFVPWVYFSSCSATFEGFTALGVDDILRYEDLPNSYATLITKYMHIGGGGIMLHLRHHRLRSGLYAFHYSHYYTEAMIEMVAEADKEYIERFDYQFERWEE
jgi:hypothetical protein